MVTLRHEDLTLEQAGVIADVVDPRRWIAQRPIRILGPFALYWTYGLKARTPRVIADRAVTWPRVRWIGRPA